MAEIADFNHDSAVQPLAEDKFPFGEDCPINRKIQAVLYHYDICVEDVGLLVQEDLHLKKDFKMANPDGNEDQKQTYQDALGTITKAVRRSRMRAAFRRILSKDPFAAIGEPQPTPSPAAKKRKTDVSLSRSLDSAFSSSETASTCTSPSTSSTGPGSTGSSPSASSEALDDDDCKLLNDQFAAAAGPQDHFAAATAAAASSLDHMTASPVHVSTIGASLNFIGHLNEAFQQRKVDGRFEFEEVEISGPCHKPVFTYAVTVSGIKYTGTAATKKQAKQNAAWAALNGNKLMPDPTLGDECQVIASCPSFGVNYGQGYSAGPQKRHTNFRANPYRR